MSTSTPRTPVPAPTRGPGRRNQDAAAPPGAAPPARASDVPPGRWVGPAAAVLWAAGGLAALAVTLTGGTLAVGDADDPSLPARTPVPGATRAPRVARRAPAGAAPALRPGLDGPPG